MQHDADVCDGISVLLMENDRDMCEQIEAALRASGYDVHAFRDADDGLKAAKAKYFPICILDLNTGGLNVLKSLKQMHPEMHVIVISSSCSTTKYDVINALNYGAFMYLENFNCEEIVVNVKKAASFYRMKKEKEEIAERYRSLVESMDAYVYLIDRDMRCVFANRKMLSIPGMKNNIIGMKFYEFFNTYSAEEMERNLRHVFKTGNALSYVTSSDEYGRWFLRTLSPVKDSEGNVIAVTVISRNITAFKEVEKELRRKNEELEWFSYTVSHDLRSPLVTIEGFVSLLRKDLERGDLARVYADLDIIEEGVRKLSAFLDDLLTLSRIGRVANPHEYVNFGEIVEDVLKLLDAKIKERGVDVIVADEFPVVHVDRVRIEEMLQNIIENSIKYMGEQKNPRIEIGYTDDEHEYVFFVRDNGIGIPADQVDKVFQMFYRLERRTEGTGAGLTIAKKIIEVHKGRIWIESEGEGKGCTVLFTLPKYDQNNEKKS